MRFSTVDQWLTWLETSHSKKIDLGLQRVTQVKENLNIDFSNATVITVAGTNGKGSCVQVLEQLLVANRVDCVSFTSPHFIRYNERIRFNGCQISDDELLAIFNQIDEQRGDISLSYFEVSAIAALVYAQQKNVPFVILEVGLGGRLDAVNCIDADIAIVTSIGIDHEEWLGNDRETIAKEKCGILRADSWAVSGDIDPPQSISDCARQQNAKLLQQPTDFCLQKQGDSYQFKGRQINGETYIIDQLTLPLLPHNSIACALQTLLLLPNAIHKFNFSTLADIQLIGRWQQMIYQQQLFILDVAHNPDAAQLLAHNLSKQTVCGKTYAIFGVMADKNIPQIIAPLNSDIDEWLVVDIADNLRAETANNLHDLLRYDYGAIVTAYLSVASALPAVLSKMTANDRCVVFGSFFTVAEFMLAVAEPTNKQ